MEQEFHPRKSNPPPDLAPTSEVRIGRQYGLHDPLPVGSKQKTKLKEAFIPRTRHGGLERIKKRKIERPFTANAPLHLVLRSNRAKRDWSMLHRKHKSKITSMIYVYATRFKVRVYSATNVGNHLHLLVKAKNRKQLADFLRVLAGRVAVTVTGAKKGVKRIGKFWDYLTWSRLVNWGQDFFGVRKFILEAKEESFHAMGFEPGFVGASLSGWNPSQAKGS